MKIRRPATEASEHSTTVPIAAHVRLKIIVSEKDIRNRVRTLSIVEAAGKDLFLVTLGTTLDYLRGTQMAQRPAFLRTAALVDKVDERKVNVPMGYAGCRLSGGLLIGYGHGYQKQYCNLPFPALITLQRETWSGALPECI